VKLIKILLLLVVILCLFLYACKQDEFYPLKQETCYIEEIGEEVICGTYMVMENPYGPARRDIALNFIILPARGSNKAPDPVFAFSGGPGAGAAASVASWPKTSSHLCRPSAADYGGHKINLNLIKNNCLTVLRY
jgi:hypothetical protein